MKKKNYTSPVVDILDIKATKLLAGSIVTTDSGDLNITIENPIPSDAGGAAAPPGLPDVTNPMSLIWSIVLLLMMSLTVSAQNVITKQPADVPDDGKTHGMKIYLRSGGEPVEYDFDELSHVTYLPGIGMKVYLKNATTSIDYLFSQMTKIDYLEDVNANANWRVVSMTDYQEAWRLEYPQVSYDNLSPTKVGAETKNQILVKKTDDYGITYSVEWDNAKVANRWTCYQLHEGNTLSTTDRNKNFYEDDEAAVTPKLEDYKNSGFSRGHLCPSADRLCSEEQNKQTFFLTNMQPQYQSHNSGLWGRLEEEVRKYATDDSKTNAHCDTLYVVKAATISDVNLTGTPEAGIYEERCVGDEGHAHELIVPKYFYMALLHYNKATDSYHALAFWTKHLSTTQSVADLSIYAISIDELEQYTGIDFFCNLPDEIEKQVESTVDLDFWKLSTTTP